MPCLKWMVPNGKPRIFPIYKKITSVGRAGGNDVSVEEESLADYHAQVLSFVDECVGARPSEEEAAG